MSSAYLRVPAVALLAGLFVSDAGATIIATAPNIVKVPPPPSVVVNTYQNNIRIRGFDERQCIVMPFDLDADGGVVPEGTQVSCHLFHTDPSAPPITLVGRARFDGQIIDVVSSSALLDAWDAVCGHPAVLYPAPGTEPNRGQETFHVDDWYLIPAADRIKISTYVPSDSDQVRVITSCEG